MTQMSDNINFILGYAQNNCAELEITHSDLINIKDGMWIELMGEYIYTRGYASKYYRIIFTAIKEGLVDKMDPMKVLSGDLEEEYNKVKSI